LDALAALSMDGIILSLGQELKVELKNEGEGIEWSEKIIENLNKALEKSKKEEKEYLIGNKINNNNKLLDGEEILIDEEVEVDDLAGEVENDFSLINLSDVPK
uniref:Uncharacterized protein n=1 Tax=Meloidogyne floridensis TaxID=298350 RepID=A0A915NNZ7_9BILA